MLKKIFALLLAFVMTVGTLTVTAFADPEISLGDPGSGEATPPPAGLITTEDELKDKLAAGGDLVLGADITVSTLDANIIPAADTTLDLAGYSITVVPEVDFIRTSGGITFTLLDSSASGTGTITGGKRIFFINVNSTLTITGGTIKGNGNYTVIATSTTSGGDRYFNLEGGHILSGTTAGFYTQSPGTNSKMRANISGGKIDDLLIYRSQYNFTTITGGEVSARLASGSSKTANIDISGGLVSLTVDSGMTNTHITGGYFTSDPGYYDTDVYEWIADTATYPGYAGYVSMKSTVTNTVKNLTTGTEYATFDLALAAIASDNETIQLMDAFDAASDLAIANISKPFILDLNGKTLTGAAPGTPLIKVTDTVVTIVNGVLNASDKTANRGGIYIQGTSEVTLGLGLTVQGATTGQYGFLGTYNGGKLIIDGAFIDDVTSGSYDSGIYIGSNTSLEIRSGYVNTLCYVTVTGDATASITVTGGYFGENSAGESFHNGATSKCTIDISGDCYFKYEPVASHLHKGLMAVDNTDPATMADYPYVLGNKPAIATVTIGETTTDLFLLADGIDAIAADPSKTGTITLLDNVEDGEGILTVDGDFNVTFDLGGYTIHRTRTTRMFSFKNEANVTLKNGTLLGFGEGYKAGTGACIQLASGSHLVLDDGLTIRGFIAEQNDSGLYGTGGAIQISGGAVLTMKAGSAIRDCRAETNAGAVFVGARCTFEFEAGAEISGCTSDTPGAAQAVMVDVNQMPGRDFSSEDPSVTRENDTFGSFVYEGTVVSAQPGLPDVVSNGFVYRGGALINDYQLNSAAALTDVAAVLTDCVTLRYYPIVLAAPDEVGKTPVLKYKLSGDEYGTVTEMDTDETGRKYFAVTDIMADMVGCKVSAYLTFAEGIRDSVAGYERERLTEISSYSVLDYCNDAHAADETNDKLTALLAATVNYGRLSAQYYNDNVCQDEADELPVVDIPEWAAAYITEVDIPASANVRTLSRGEGFAAANDGTNYAKIKGSFLRIASKVVLCFSVKASSTAGLKAVVTSDGGYSGEFQIGGLDLREGKDDEYALVVGGLSPAAYDEIFTVTLKSGDSVIQTLTYSANSYLFAARGLDPAGDLVKAIYAYGLAAEAY